jgi:signal transduction histidine kinase
MVAGESACRCEKCGMVCKGRFAGCAAVWERGPVIVALGEKSRQVPVAASAVSSSLPAPMSETTDLRPLLQALRAELRVLNRNIDLTWVRRDDSADLTRAAAQVMEAAEDLPSRIVSALAAALESQHRAIMADVRQAISTSEAATAGVLEVLPRRLASQLDEFGDRFGGQLIDLRDQVQDLIDVPRAEAAAEQGEGERNHALLAEIDQLTRVVAGTIELLGQQASPAQLRPAKNGGNGSNGGNGRKPLASEPSS